MARNTKYYPNTFPLLAEGHARNGLKDVDIAKKLGISKATLYNYENKYVDFLDSIKRGKHPVDFEVENSLLKRANGYTYEEVTKIMSLDKEGKPQLKETRVVTKEIIPDVGAQAFWLKNRKPDKWRDKHDIEHSGEIKGDKTIKINYSDLNDDN